MSQRKGGFIKIRHNIPQTPKLKINLKSHIALQLKDPAKVMMNGLKSYQLLYPAIFEEIGSSIDRRYG